MVRRSRLGTPVIRPAQSERSSRKKSGQYASGSNRSDGCGIALFGLAIDSKRRGCDLVGGRIGHVKTGDYVRDRALPVQRKTGRPVQFEILEPARTTLLTWLERRGGSTEDFAFPSRFDQCMHLSTRRYGRLVNESVSAIGLKAQDCGTHSLGRTRVHALLKGCSSPSLNCDLERTAKK
jgi:integrase